MTMTKKDYELIASVLSENRPMTARDAAWARKWERITVELGKKFAERNPRFCQKKWSERCNGG